MDKEADIKICPKCKSTAITTGKRGYTFWTGIFGRNKIVNRCGNCGRTWKLGQ